MAETSFIIQNGKRLDLKDSTARKQIGSCDELQTDVKHCLVHAINELNEKVKTGGGGSGEPGADGKDGVSCTHSWSGTVLTITSASGTSSADLKGPKGDPGNDGYTPRKNIDYFDGAPGDAGKDGKDGYTPVKGVDYFDGKDGKPGADGEDGVSITHKWNGTVLTVTSASGTSSMDLKGPPGADGTMTFEDLTDEQKASLKGDPGKDGANGSPGAAGANATINGVNTLTIKAGTGISLSQIGSTLTINSSASATSMTVAQIRAICT